MNKRKKARSWDSASRCTANEKSEQAATAVAGGWQALALAGAPRCARTDRDKLLQRASTRHDQARALLADARRNLGIVAADIERAEKRRDDPQSWDRQGPKPADRATITRLQPKIEDLSREVVQLGATLAKYRGGEWKRPHPCAERDVALRLSPLLSTPAPRRPCNWCGQMERDKWDNHYALDGAGFLTVRGDGRKFCCSTCFSDGRDLAEPAPPPVDAVPDAEHVDCVVERKPLALPARSAALPADGSSP